MITPIDVNTPGKGPLSASPAAILCRLCSAAWPRSSAIGHCLGHKPSDAAALVGDASADAWDEHEPIEHHDRFCAIRSVVAAAIDYQRQVPPRLSSSAKR